jgi:two-component system response regulator YesN
MNKIRIILVDDELTARNTIKGFLENDPVYSVVADFQDAKTALQWIHENEVEILLCDMQMPTINGLELLRLVRVSNPDIAAIAISGFDNYEYTRGCMVEGVADYLLKNGLTREKLRKVLDGVRERFPLQSEERPLRNLSGYQVQGEAEYSADFLRGLVRAQEIRFDTTNVCPVAVSPDYRYLGNGNFSELRKDLCKAVADMIAQILGTEYPYVLYITPQQHLLLLLSFKGVNSILYILNILANFCTRLRRTALRLLDTTLTIGTGSPQASLESAILQSRELDARAADKLYWGGDRVFTLQNAPRAQPKGPCAIQPYLGQLNYVLAEGSGLGAAPAVQDVFAVLREHCAGREEIQAAVAAILESLAEHGCLTPAQKTELQQRFALYEILEVLYTDLQQEIEHCLQAREKASAGNVSAVVAKAQEYIRQNYARDVSLQDCADCAGTSYTHLSRLFRQETGMHFVEYLNHIRLSAAKSLLIRQDLSMKEIVEQSGFRNYNYFFKVFRESEGMTPSEFVAKNCSKS